MHAACLILLLSTMTTGGMPQPQDPAAGFAALRGEYDEAMSGWRKASPGVTPADPLWVKSYEACPDLAFATRFLAFAEAHPKTSEAAEAALVVLEMNRSRDRSIFPSYLRARDLLIRDHLEDGPVTRAFLSTPIFLSGQTEPYFRALLARSTDRDTLARACMALVRCNKSRAGVAARPFFDHPEDHPDYLKTTLFLNDRLDPDYVRNFRDLDTQALADENAALLERVITEFGDIPLAPPWAGPEVKARAEGKTLAGSAKANLEAIRSLAVGKVAPEIDGQDVDGRPMKLSDYRGKVVVLVFWGTWCGPCMRFLPTEKALAERLKDRPFALVGINSDVDREKLKARVAEEGIAWRSWFDGGKAGGPIATRWNVNAWPTIIVLDQQGVIRFKGLPHHTPKPLDDAVDSLLREGAKPREVSP